jgi:hypothetical protein
MARVTITDAQGVVETPGTGLVISSATTVTGATTYDGAIVGNAAVGSNNIVGVVQCEVGAEVTLRTNATTTVSEAISIPANCIIVGIALRATATAAIPSGDFGLNVGTAADGTGGQVVATAAANIASTSITTPFTNGDVISSAGYGAIPEAATYIPLVTSGLYSATARSVYFRTTASAGNPSAGKYIPMVYVVRIA